MRGLLFILIPPAQNYFINFQLMLVNFILGQPFFLISHFICSLYNNSTINKYFDEWVMQSCRKTSHWKLSINETFSYIIKSNALIDLISGQITNIN
jgi:hypothetical protein